MNFRRVFSRQGGNNSTLCIFRIEERECQCLFWLRLPHKGQTYSSSVGDCYISSKTISVIYTIHCMRALTSPHPCLYCILLVFCILHEMIGNLLFFFKQCSDIFVSIFYFFFHLTYFCFYMGRNLMCSIMEVPVRR